MKLIISDITYQGALEANESAQALESLLPMTLTMNELNGNEKYVYLNQSLRKDEPSVPASIKAGDLMLFSDNCIVLFYQDFQTTYSYVPLAHFAIDADFKNVLGSGSVSVSFAE